MPGQPKRTDADKVRRAASRTDRPGEACKAAPSAWAPQIDFARCEGKGDCVEVCPHGVFEVGRIADADFAKLSFIGKMKQIAHGRQVAHTPALDACLACGLCVVACPEKAITLIRLAG